jgi:hypothetical protein
MKIQSKEYCIQCRDITSGKIGSFLFERTEAGRSAISPVFESLQDFFIWARQNGWVSLPGSMFTMTKEVA